MWTSKTPKLRSSYLSLTIFFRAAEEGEALKTLRIFARIIAGQLENNTLDASTFKFRASSLSGLPERELKLLKEYLDKTEEVFSTSKVTGKGAHERELRVQKNVESALVPELYVSDHDLSAAASLLAGRGLLVPVERAVFGGALTNYFASPLAIDIKSLARDLD